MRTCRHAADKLRFGQVVPVTARHFFLHHLELQAGRVEGVLVVGQPELLACVCWRGVALVGTRAKLCFCAVPLHRPFRRQNGPAHLRKATRKKRRNGFNNVVFGLKPCHMQRPASGPGIEGFVSHSSEAHKSLHFVHVTAHRFGQVFSLQHVCIKRVMLQVGLLRHAPEQAVKQLKTGRVAVQNDGFAQNHEVRADADGRGIARVLRACV